MCCENYVKDRASHDMVEALNVAIGAHDELKMLLGGLTCASALFASTLSARTELLNDHYETVASIMQSKSGLSFQHMRNLPLFYEGKLLFKKFGEQ